MRFKFLLLILFLSHFIEAQTLFSFMLLKDNKKVVVYEDSSRLYYKFYKNGKVELLYPKNSDKEIDFRLSNDSSRLTFSNHSVVYEVYEDGDSLGVKVKIGDKKYDLKGDISTKKGTLSSIDEFHFRNVINKKYREDIADKTFYSIEKALKYTPFVETLDLSDMNLKELDPRIGLFKNLKELRLDDNKLTALPKEIGELKNLRILSAYKNQFTSLPNSIKELTNLVSLRLDYNKLQNVDNIAYLSKLESISIEENHIKKLPKDIGNLVWLESFYFSDNYIKEIPDSFSKLKNIKAIRARNNMIKKIPQELKDLTKVKLVDISFNPIDYFPKSICQMPDVEEIYFSKTNIRNIPSCIQNLKELKKIVFIYNDMQYIASQMADLPKLKEMYMSLSPKWIKLPKGFEKLKWLKIIVDNKTYSVSDYELMEE